VGLLCQDQQFGFAAGAAEILVLGLGTTSLSVRHLQCGFEARFVLEKKEKNSGHVPQGHVPVTLSRIERFGVSVTVTAGMLLFCRASLLTK
jgi:hypothetical protein